MIIGCWGSRFCGKWDSTEEFIMEAGKAAVFRRWFSLIQTFCWSCDAWYVPCSHADTVSLTLVNVSPGYNDSSILPARAIFLNGSAYSPLAVTTLSTMFYRRDVDGNGIEY
jgi:hypothetical protein